MKRILIKNAAIVTEEDVLGGYCLLVENGKIAQIADTISKINDISSCETIDAAGHFLCAGFIDLHFHGIHTYLIDNGPEELAKICGILPKYGVTGFLATVCPLPKGKDIALVKSLASGDYAGAQVQGFHLEGPFLSMTGCLSPEALGHSDLQRVCGLIDAARPYKTIFSISPEFQGICELLPKMTADSTPAFITHTRSNVAQAMDAIRAGACHATHFYDVFYAPEMTDPGVRPCGAVEAILASPNVSVDFILDGVHVDPVAVKMALRCKGNDKVCLITDANIGAGLGAGRYMFGCEEVEIASQGAPARLVKCKGLAGSGLTMNLAVKNAVDMLGVALPQAVKMASANPARVLGLSNKGVIRQNYDADLVLMDDHFDVIRTWVHGKTVFQK